jgi:hypothetical protein
MPFIIPLPRYDTKNIDAKTALNKKTTRCALLSGLFEAKYETA